MFERSDWLPTSWNSKSVGGHLKLTLTTNLTGIRRRAGANLETLRLVCALYVMCCHPHNISINPLSERAKTQKNPPISPLPPSWFGSHCAAYGPNISLPSPGKRFIPLPSCADRLIPGRQTSGYLILLHSC